MPGPMSVPNGNARLLALTTKVEVNPKTKEIRVISVGEQRMTLLHQRKLDTGKTKKKRK